MRIKNVIEDINTSKVQEFYNKRAANFTRQSESFIHCKNIYSVTGLNDNNPSITEERNKAEVSKLLPKLKFDENSCVLDLACGFGRWLDAIPESICKYRGIDFSDELIKLAKSRNTRQNAEFFTGSVLDCDKIFPDEMGTFNRVLIMGLLVYMNDSDILPFFEKVSKHYCVGGGGL